MDWTEEDDVFSGASAAPAPTPRTPWQRFKDAYFGAAVDSEIGGAAFFQREALKRQGYSEEQINRRFRQLREEIGGRAEADPVIQGEGFDKLSPANIGRGAVDLVGGMLGGIDPTYVLAPGRNAVTRIGSQMGINAGADAASQGIQIKKGIRDEWDWEQTAANALVGGVFQGGSEVARGVRSRKTAKIIASGAQHPDFEAMVPITIHTESRGNPNAVSPKGARGRMQVMPGTIKDPGFGIRPSNGSQADTERVGRQYLAAMLGRYDGDQAKAWAAYNWGPGNLDRAVKKHGDNWLAAAPKETRNYVSQNLRLLGKAPSEIETKIAWAEGRGPDVEAVERLDLEDEALNELEARTMKTEREPLVDDLPSIDLMARANDALAPEDNVVKIFPNLEEELANIGRASEELAAIKQKYDVLTPAERQEMDASTTPRAPVDNYNDRFTTTDGPPVPANDLRKPTIAQTFKAMLKDDSGSYRDADESIPSEENPDLPDAVRKMAEVVKSLEKLLPEQRRNIRQEKKIRVAKMAQMQEKVRGEQGFYAELSQLKGEYPKADFEEVRPKFEQKEIDDLFNLVIDNPQFTMFDKVNARDGLLKILNGELPSRSELALLADIFPDDIIQGLLKHRGLKDRLKDAIGNAVNLPRSLMSSFDLSAPFRQGIFVATRLAHRKEFWKAFKTMFEVFGDEKAYNAMMDEIYSRPNYLLMKESNLQITKRSRFLEEREEDFMSQWADKAPVIGIGVRASNRAYMGFLNKLRADLFDSIVNTAKDAGADLSDDHLGKSVARFVNAATGRGSLGKFSQAAPILNGLLFSPRLLASRVQLLNPMFYASMHPVARKEAIKSAIAYTITMSTILTAAKLGGAEVETDPRSTDFAKIKVGNTRYDIAGGFQQYLRGMAQLVSGATKGPSGDIKELNSGEFGSRTRADVILSFLRSKESPIASYIHDALEGSNIVGEEFNAARDAVERFLPFIATDMAEAIEEYGALGILLHSPGAFGVGVQTYDAEKEKAERKAERDARKAEKKAEAKDEWDWGDTQSTNQTDEWDF